MLCCCFGVRLPVCSVLNSAQLLCHALASAIEIEVLPICSGGSALLELGWSRYFVPFRPKAWAHHTTGEH